jgi:nucleoside-diphosphate-sugar epimerase
MKKDLTELEKRRVLINGSSAFAASGLPDHLINNGFLVDGLAKRLPIRPTDGYKQLVGDLGNASAIEGLSASYDTLVNYVVLKDKSIPQNLAYIDSILQFCTERDVKRLVHISSVSCYPGDSKLLDEFHLIEDKPEKKGTYGALKVACDQYLLKNTPKSIQLVFVRPGFILGNGLVDPIVGMGFRTSWNRLLLLGDPKNVVPITTREILNAAISSILNKSKEDESLPAYLIVDPDSPTRREFIDFLSQHAGYGYSSITFPPFFWKIAAIGAGLFERAVGTRFNARRILKNAAGRQGFNSEKTSKFLGLKLHVDWRRELINSLENQEKNFENRVSITSKEIKQTNDPSMTVGFIGFGRIVKQKYLPALRKINNKMRLAAFDVLESTTNDVPVCKLGASPLVSADLYVVASPGPQHVEAICHLRDHAGPVLVEKPLGYNSEDIEKWRQFVCGRESPVFVCHNYRFKKNILKMLSFLEECNPGKLLHADVWFQSPPVANDGASWLRDERKARTLLYDYSIHFLDAGCMFDQGTWEVDTLRYELNPRGETSLISGHASSSNYSVSFLLRQGSIPRRARIRYVFQNYDVHLEFFPETFSVSSSNPSASLLRREANELAKSSRQKIFDKLRGTDRDLSHFYVLQSCLNQENNNGLLVGNVSNFYNLLFDIGNRVYEQ